MTEAAVRQRYSELADSYIRMFGAVDRVATEDLVFLRRSFDGCAGAILDAGCGPGHLTAYLTELGFTASGVDLVPEFITSARARWPGIDFAIGSVRDVGLADRTLGGILAWFSLIHCAPDELADILNDFRRMLTPGGRLVVGFFAGDAVEPFDHKVTTAYRWPVDEMSRTLASAGFAEHDRVWRAGSADVRPHAAIAARAR
ncbi:class I SAM-dependent DNA methyltransferase [Mycobacterium sp. ZZG]